MDGSHRQVDDRSSWRFAQVFGDISAVQDVKDEDIISAVAFNMDGNFLAVGDRGGRVVVFERVETKDKNHRRHVEYRFVTEFESHQPEFDYLRSIEIPEQVNKIKWCHDQCGGRFMLTTNDKTIKLWKVHNKADKAPSFGNLLKDTPRSLGIPRIVRGSGMVGASPKRQYECVHDYHINSLALSSEGTSFLSADDLRVNIWDLETTATTFNAVDIKPPSLDNLVEVITTATYHPKSSAVFAYGTSRNLIRLCDLRASALCDYGSKTFNDQQASSQRTYHQEIASSISDLTFSADGKYIFARDFLSLKVWDVAMESRPLHTIPIHDSLKPHLPQLFEQDAIFDRFECAVSPNGSHVLTGSYNNNFHIYDRMGRGGVCIEASRGRTKEEKLGATRRNKTGWVGDVNTAKKVVHLDWHPQANIIAIATLTNLFLYGAK
ncbi:protein phosphatase PP2A regulatory subunit B [Carpediemonas membranifera]|uniref:Serine/threonine-protein phosphatase 2A 55 kDa regulatory subunit B n=1 Tax=Carpediemonas membranifera TaxID=201153 RepID=A0A8J6DZI6_9EUKA|nr:protein phosphatase PP2A regulatory subunit B [Carpediemonas membranifera]|eukprot:KAG9390446.1 protein phosphatase PP2A regulatory subunit B [Carpediemonas membranifera]